MAAGDVTVEIVNADVDSISSSVNGLRNGANDKWGFVSVANGMQVAIINVEET